MTTTTTTTTEATREDDIDRLCASEFDDVFLGEVGEFGSVDCAVEHAIDHLEATAMCLDTVEDAERLKDRFTQLCEDEEREAAAEADKVGDEIARLLHKVAQLQSAQRREYHARDIWAAVGRASDEHEDIGDYITKPTTRLKVGTLVRHVRTGRTGTIFNLPVSAQGVQSYAIQWLDGTLYNGFTDADVIEVW